MVGTYAARSARKGKTTRPLRYLDQCCSPDRARATRDDVRVRDYPV